MVLSANTIFQHHNPQYSGSCGERVREMLTERKKIILKALIDEYIQTAVPVGSKSVAERIGLGISSATIRNEMADLEEMGYLLQPHASAGRVPSHTGYRVYVNELMNNYRLTTRESDEFDRIMRIRIQEVDKLVSEAGKLLSELTRYAALAVVPHFDAETIRRMEIITCDVSSYVIIIVTLSGIVRNKICRTKMIIPNDNVNALVFAFNKHISGLPPSAVTLSHIGVLREAGGECAAELVNAIVEFLQEIINEPSGADLHLRGAANLLRFPEYQNVDKAKSILDFLAGAENSDWLSKPNDDVVAVSIGEENRVIELKDASVVVAGFPLSGNRHGFVGIVGPTRMDYSRLTARLKYFAEGLGNLLKDILLDDNNE